MEPTAILFYAAACVWLFFWRSPSRLAAVKSAMIMGAICILFVLPWTIRNYVVFGAFVPIKSSMGGHLLHGNHPYSETGGIIFGPETRKVFSKEELAELQKMDEVQANRLMERKAIEFIKADPGTFIQRTVKRIYYYWAPTNPYRTTPYDTLRFMTYGPVLLLGIFGLFFIRRNWQERSLLLTLMLSYPLFYYITQVTINRYRFVPEAFLLILASFAAVELVGRLGWARSRA